MAGFELTLYGRIWVTPKAQMIANTEWHQECITLLYITYDFVFSHRNSG
jgi:hypothetical protein